MNRFFNKINVKFIKDTSILLNYVGDLDFTFGIDTPELKGKTLLAYYNLTNDQEFYTNAISYNFKIKPKSIKFAKISNKGWLDVHRDGGDARTALNYYISTSMDETIFYTPKDGVIRESYYEYNFDDLNVEERLVAKPNEAYLLNINELHSVTKVDEEPRIFLHISWNEPYDVILKSLQDLLE